MAKAKKKRKRGCLGRIVSVLLLLVCAITVLKHWNTLFGKWKSGQDFGIETAVSRVDFNGNGRDDYRDLLLGARKDAENLPHYNGAYFDGGYPPDHIGVCTDLVWRAFREAGYSLKDMVDADIARRSDVYGEAATHDRNIDFRRVTVLRVFFDSYALRLTDDLTEIDQWQPGDIVIFGKSEHIGIVSDRRNDDGIPLLIHNSGQLLREEDVLGRTKLPLTGHYRFDASEIPQEILRSWQD